MGRTWNRTSIRTKEKRHRFYILSHIIYMAINLLFLITQLESLNMTQEKRATRKNIGVDIDLTLLQTQFILFLIFHCFLFSYCYLLPCNNLGCFLITLVLTIHVGFFFNAANSLLYSASTDIVRSDTDDLLALAIRHRSNMGTTGLYMNA